MSPRRMRPSPIEKRSRSDPASIHFSVLGPIALERNGREVPLRLGHQKRLLAALLVERNRVLSVDRIVEVLWGNRPPSTAENAVQVYVSRLRRALHRAEDEEELLVTDPPGYRLRIEPNQVDADRFERAASDGRELLRSGKLEGAATALRAGLDLWRGDAFGELGAEPFARSEVTRLEELRLGALDDWLDAKLSLGRQAEILPELERVVDEHPLHERFSASFMLALYRSGRQADALEHYLRTRRVLNEELGVDPGPDLQDLHRRILNQDPALIPGRPRIKGNVPTPLTAFFGREREIVRIKQLLQGARLVTLTGAGGSGKTRLAFRIAADLVEAYEDGAWVVELADLTDPDLVPAAVASALQIDEQPGRSIGDTLETALRERKMLVVLDNCEHVLGTAASLAERLLTRSANLTLLTTTREPLRARGEVTLEIPPLEVPPPGEIRADVLASMDVVRLFVERATAADPEFRLGGETAAAVAKICRRLDGIPLAVELAAARISAVTVQEIAARLDDHLRLLTAGTRTLPRHQTLRAVMDWSYELLTEPERRTLERLSVFAGSFPLGAAEEVCGAEPLEPREIAALVARLRDRSLLTSDRRGDEARYGMLDTVRAYARARVESSAEEPLLRDRHAEHFVRVAEEAEPALQGAESSHWVGRLEVEFDDLRAAGRHLVATGRAQDELRLAGALGRFFYLAGHYAEGRRWLESALERGADAPSALRARAGHATGMLAFLECDYEPAADHCVRALDAFRETGDRRGEAICLTTLGSIARENAEYDLALALHQEALKTFREIGDRWGEGHSLQLSGFASWLHRDFVRAREWSGESLEIFGELGDRERMGWAITDLGAVAMYEGSLEEASEALDEAHSVFRDIGFAEGIAWTLNLQGVLALRRGDRGIAGDALEEALEHHRTLGDRWRAASVLEALAAVRASQDEHPRAAELLEEAATIRAEIGTPVPEVEREDRAATLAAVRNKVSHGGPSAGTPH